MYNLPHMGESSEGIAENGKTIRRRAPENNVEMFRGTRNVVINDGTFVGIQQNNNNVRVDDSWVELLRSETAPGAFHDSDDRRDAPKCHPRTRIAVLKDIMDWVNDPSTKEQFYWLYGPAGTGKSSIAQAIAELCKTEGKLASDFFFARTSPGRNTYVNLIPTLACSIPAFVIDPRSPPVHGRGHLHRYAHFRRSLRIQLDTVILKPLSRALKVKNDLSQQSTKRLYPHVIIIDGLDECNGRENQQHILSSFSEALRATPVPLIFLIVSRPEHEIRTVFNDDLYERTRRILLGNTFHGAAEMQYMHLFDSAKKSDKHAALYELLSDRYRNAIKSCLGPKSDVESASKQDALTGLALSVVMALEAWSQDQQNMINVQVPAAVRLAPAKFPVAKSGLPLSAYTPLSFLASSSLDQPKILAYIAFSKSPPDPWDETILPDDYALALHMFSYVRALHSHVFSFVELYDLYEESAQNRFRRLLMKLFHANHRFHWNDHQMNLLLQTTHILTRHEESQAGYTSTVHDLGLDPEYLVDSSKICSAAIRIFDALTADNIAKPIPWVHDAEWGPEIVVVEDEGPSVTIVVMLFCFSLQFIPAEPRLVKHLRDNRHKRIDPLLRGTEWEWEFEEYISQYIKVDEELERVQPTDAEISRGESQSPISPKCS